MINNLKRTIFWFALTAMRSVNKFTHATIKYILVPILTRHFSESVEKNTPKKQNQIVLAPVPFYFSALQFKVLANIIAKAGYKSKIIYDCNDYIKKLGEQLLSEKSNLDKLEFGSFGELINFLYEFVNYEPIIARGVIDEFVSTCRKEVFSGQFQIERKFLQETKAKLNLAQTITESASVVILNEGAYCFFSALIANMHKLGKPCWLIYNYGITPAIEDKHNGMLVKYTYADLVKKVEQKKYDDIKVDKFLNQKFSGIIQLYSSDAYADKKKLTPDLLGKKFLFLHVFRDANLNTIEKASQKELIFKTNFEWADFALGVVAKEPSKWVIKQHPSSKRYRDNEYIFRFLLKKHNIENISVANDISTHEILLNKLPVYTNSGTIALESLIFGYKSHCCSKRFPEELVKLAKSKEEIEHNMLLDFENARNIHNNPLLKKIAKTLLYELDTNDVFDKKNEFVAFWNPIQDGSGVRQEWNAIISQLSLIKLLINRKADKNLLMIANEIVSSITV